MTDDLLYKLAIRLSVHVYEGQPELLVGRLPEPLPLPIPLPPGSVVLGTLTQGQASAQTVLDTPMTQKEVHAFYEQEMPKQGWKAPGELSGMMGQRGGFAHTFSGGMSYQTYYHDSGWALTTQLSDVEKGITGVRLQLRRENAPARQRQRRMHHDIYSIFPTLVPPEGAQQQGGDGGGGSDSAHISATLEMPEAWEMSRLVAHYTAQLRQAGWTPIADEATEHSSWCTWSFRDTEGTDWLAAFHLFQLPGEAIRYHLGLRADVKETRPRGKSGWFSSSFISGSSMTFEAQ